MMSFFNYKKGSIKDYMERGEFFLLWDSYEVRYVEDFQTTTRLVGIYLKSNLYLFISKFFSSRPNLYCFWKRSLLILNIAYGSSWSEISSVLMTLQCINLVEMLELMWLISVLPFLVGLVTCCCKEKVGKMFLYLFVDSFWWLSKLKMKSPVTIRTPFQVVYILARNCSNILSHSSFSTSIELGWYAAQTKVGMFLFLPWISTTEDFKSCVLPCKIGSYTPCIKVAILYKNLHRCLFFQFNFWTQCSIDLHIITLVFDILWPGFSYSYNVQLIGIQHDWKLVECWH